MKKGKSGRCTILAGGWLAPSTRWFYYSIWLSMNKRIFKTNIIASKDDFISNQDSDLVVGNCWTVKPSVADQMIHGLKKEILQFCNLVLFFTSAVWETSGGFYLLDGYLSIFLFCLSYIYALSFLFCSPSISLMFLWWMNRTLLAGLLYEREKKKKNETVAESGIFIQENNQAYISQFT